MQITNSEKYELLDYDFESICTQIQKEIWVKELYLIRKEELLTIQNAIIECIELDIEAKSPEDNSRLSFYAINRQLVVVRRKKINIKLLLELLFDIFSFSNGNGGVKITAIISILLKTFVNFLDEEVTLVYSYLCIEYFINGRKFNNIEIYAEINKYLKQNLEFIWSTAKINKILSQLENLKVIEFNNGALIVKEKIHFD